MCCLFCVACFLKFSVISINCCAASSVPFLYDCNSLIYNRVMSSTNLSLNEFTACQSCYYIIIIRLWQVTFPSHSPNTVKFSQVTPLTHRNFPKSFTCMYNCLHSPQLLKTKCVRLGWNTVKSVMNYDLPGLVLTHPPKSQFLFW